jgi:hypothetical protein
MPAKKGKVEKVMKEYKEGKLHSGKKGPVVKIKEAGCRYRHVEAGMSKKKKK